MKNATRQLHVILMWICLLGCISCDNTHQIEVNQQTLLMYFPWSSNLQSFFNTNVQDMEEAIIARGGLNHTRVLVYMACSADSATLYDVRYDASSATCQRIPLHTFAHADYQSADYVASVFQAAKLFAPAPKYALCIGSHGFGWIPTADYAAGRSGLQAPEREMAEGEAPMIMRFYGDYNCQVTTDITTLAQAMKQADWHTEYILFDCCTMAMVEVAYDLRQVTDYVIASVSEIWGTGMPYRLMGDAMLETVDYAAICQAFWTNCQSMPYPCGTLSVTACAWLEELASFTGQMQACHPQTTSTSSLQVYDAYLSPIFYDYADYMRHLGLDDTQLQQLDNLMSKVVPYSTATASYYCEKTRRTYPIRSYCGLTTSAPSTNACCSGFANTAWNIACQSR